MPPENPSPETRDIIEALIAGSRAAFEETRVEREAIRDPEDVPGDVNVGLVVLAIVMSAPRIEETVEAARARVPASFDLRNVTRLRLYAAATWHALVRTTPASQFVAQALFREAIPVHRTMSAWARRLAQLGWIRREPPQRIGNAEAPRPLAHDLVTLAEWLTEAWPQCEPLGLPASELARSTAIGLDLFVLMSNEPRAEDPRTLALAFELMARAYDECRRLVALLRRREGDLEDIAPALDALGQSPGDFAPAAPLARDVPRGCLPN